MVGTMIVMGYYGLASAGLMSAGMVAAAFAINFAVSQIVTRVFGQNQQGPQDNGTREQVAPSNVNAIPIVYGDAYLGGTFVDAVLSTDQKTMYYVLAVSCISPNGQFGFDTTDMYYGDRKITFDGTDQAKVVSLTDEAGNVDDKIKGSLWIYLYKSNDAGVITPLNSTYLPNDGQVMGATTIPSDLRWPSSGRQMNGLAFAIVRLHYNQDAGTTSLSPITFKARHHLNGTGYAIPGDVWYDYITNVAYGGAVDPAFVDADSATALNNYSNEVITFQTYTGSPSTQPRYRINGVIDAGQTVLNNLDKIMTCCDSWMAYNAASGKWSAVINKSETASYSFNDDNIIGEIRVSATDITQSINQVEAKFPNGASRDQPDYVNLATPSGLLYPNEPVNKYSVSYDLINDSVRSQYLANRILEQAREDLIVSFSTTYYGIQVDAGAVVSVTNSDYGWTNKLFRVVKVNEASLPDGSLGAKLEMTEYSAAVYDDFDITQYAPVPNSSIPSPTYFSALIAPTVTGYPAASVPYFDVTITFPSTGRVTSWNLFYTTTPTPSTTDWKLLANSASANSQPVTNGSTYVFSNQILGAGTYYFAYNVSNDIGQTSLSALSSAFSWSPTGMTGPTGPRSASGYIYYATATQTPPSAPSASGYNFTTGTFSSLSAGWSTTFTAPNPVTNPATQAGSKFWAVRYNVSESTFGGSQTVTLTSVFNWQNLDGLVTFTNVSAPSGTTFIDGGNIITNSITTSRLVAGDLTAFNVQTASSGSRWQITGGTYAMQIRGFYGSESSPRMILDSSDGTVSFDGRASTSVNYFTSPTTLYTVSLQNSGGGNAVWARSTSGGNSVLGDASTSTGHGGHFKGNATRAPLFLEPQASLPSNRAYGSVCFYNGWLCFANGTHWFQSNGTQLT